MIIENTGALKYWLTSCLARLCEADPAALAKYVMALVKKDKPEKELKAFCLDQLEVFLLKETKCFVELLFETLKTKAYLHSPLENLLPIYEKTSPPDALIPLRLVSTSAMSIGTYPVSTLGENNKEKKPQITNPKLEIPEQKRFPQRRSRSSSKSHSDGPGDNSRGVLRSRSRETDRQRRRPERKKPYPHRPDTRHTNYRSRLDHIDRDRDCNLKEKDNRRNNKSRSRSTSYNRNRSRSFSSAEFSPSGSRSKDRRSRSNSKNSRRTEDALQKSLDHGDTDYRLGSTVTNISAAGCRTSGGNKNKIGGRNRCHDYDEKGFCMRGDQCPFDHGNDPLVVEDVSILSFNGSANPQVTSNASCVPRPLILPTPPGVENPPLPPPSSPPPPPPLPPASGSFAPEPYNPEAPSMFGSETDHIPFWSPSSPPPLHPPVPPSPKGQQPIITSRIPGVPDFNPYVKPPSFHTPPKVQRTRELIGVPTLGAEAIDSTNPIGKIVPNSLHQPMVSLQSGQMTSTVSSVGPVPSPVQSCGPAPIPGENFFTRKPFDYTRLGARMPIKKTNDRCVLELRKVPKYQNSVSHLSNHFSQFGHISNILTGIDNDPEAALICFSNHAAATAAYRHKEAVLQNRFIKLFWHNKTSPEVMNPNGPIRNSNDNQLRKDNVTEVTSTTPIATNENGENKFTQNEFFPEKAVLAFNQGQQKGNIPRTFNYATFKKNNVLLPITNQGAYRKETVRRKLELHKKMQEMLHSYVANQKLLIEKLIVCKNEKEKDYVKKTIEETGVKIFKLQSDLKKEMDEIQKLMKVCNGAHTPATQILPSNKTEAEKELLDAEMDLYNEQHKGGDNGRDVSDLLSKVMELKQQTINRLGGSCRGAPSGGRSFRYRGRGRGRPMVSVSRSVDHRPKKILVTNATVDTENLRKHFLQFGIVESVDEIDAGTVVTFKTRKEAEMAHSLGLKLGELILVMNWYHEPHAPEQPVKQEVFQSIPERNKALFEEEEEEEEEEDSEARSWRR